MEKIDKLKMRDELIHQLANTVFPPHMQLGDIAVKYYLQGVEDTLNLINGELACQIYNKAIETEFEGDWILSKKAQKGEEI